MAWVSSWSRTAPRTMSIQGYTRGIRVAIWSGPRNISTAMMRSWGNRDDTFVCDEPLYAHYLLATGIQHPGREEVLASQETDWRKVVAWLAGDVPEGKAIFYQKQMAHHLLPDVRGDWVLSMRNAFLIRDPRDVLKSFSKVMPDPGVEDTGLPQQWDLFQMLQTATGRTPAVLDARDVLDDPRTALMRLCSALEVPFHASMLSWEPGPRVTDGVWAKHWYSGVQASTGFRPYVPRKEALPDALSGVHDECVVFYEKLHSQRLLA